MKVREILEGVGRITPQNMTKDVGPNAISIEAKKFGNIVDKDGRPPIIDSKSARNTSPHKAYNLGLTNN